MKRVILVLATLLAIASLLLGCNRVESTANGDTPMPGSIISADLQ